MSIRRESARTRIRLVAGALWAWDLWIALVVGPVFGLLWVTTDQLDAKWGHLIPIVTFSLGASYIAWNKRDSLRSLLKDSDYGELLRMADPREESVSLPFSVVMYVGWGSAAVSALVALVIDGVDSRRWQAVLIGVTMFMVTWTALGIASVMAHSRRQARNAADVQAMREDMEARQRLSERNSHP